MQEQLKEYAKLLVEVGVNVQKGQNLVITSAEACEPGALYRACDNQILAFLDVNAYFYQ